MRKRLRCSRNCITNLIQTVYETELVYVYEDAKTAGAAVSLICPNCGAPIQSWG